MIVSDSPYGLANKISQLFDKKDGFFIEAGANNGIWQSNTLYLETELGWSGLLIEPNKQKFEECKKNRKDERNIFYNCALVDFDYEQNYIEGYFNENDYENSLMAQVCVNNPEFSKDDKRWQNKLKVQVPARRLSDLLSENNIEEIDFLSLDVEGYEYNVLNGIDFKHHFPKMICAEIRDAHRFGSESFFHIKQLLEKNNYTLTSKLAHNYFFERMS
tara:strand:- start:895 stop:1545 length:651 start_codon:yes stop_codon:yes gene_type:complete